MKNETFTIGELAKRARVNAQTIRYYERRSLVSPNTRSDSGYRYYSTSELKRVLFIKGAQELGFTLDEIQQLLSLRSSASKSCGAVQKRAEAKLSEIQRKISALRNMERVLLELVSDCQKKRPTSTCPMLEKMEVS